MNQNEDTIHQKYIHVSNLLRNYRINEGISQQELSEHTNLHYNTIYRLEQGLPVSFLTLLRVTEALDFPLRELFLEYN